MSISSNDLTGTKNDSNTSFTIPVVPNPAASLRIYFNTGTLYICDQTKWDARSAEAKTTAALVIGQNVTLGLAPSANDDLWYECEI